ncbi:MAG: DUF697 domain-containing protein [Xanthobacteraceae bacterium]|jgi:uncharacterized protein (DUF697 family)
MKRKPLPKAITRSIASLRDITAGFAGDEQGRVPRRAMIFDAVEPEPAPKSSIAPAGAAAGGGPASQQPDRNALSARPDRAHPLAAKRRTLAKKIVDRHRNYAALGGLVPIPVANIASITAVNVRMVKQLSELYGVSFQRDRTRSFIVGLIGGAVPAGAGVAASSTLMWIVPGGLLWGLGVSAITAGALTRGIGSVFIDSFEAELAEGSAA